MKKATGASSVVGGGAHPSLPCTSTRKHCAEAAHAVDKDLPEETSTLLDVMQQAFDVENEQVELCVSLEGDFLEINDVKTHGLHVTALV